MAKTISKEIPLAEITLRKYEKPSSLEGRELSRKLCLSLGLLQPGDSRDTVVDVFHVLVKSNENLTSHEICKKVIEERKHNRLSMLGIAPSNIRRQLKRLRDLMLIEKRLNAYRLSEDAKLEEIFAERIEKFMIPSITARIKEYLRKIDESRSSDKDND